MRTLSRFLLVIGAVFLLGATVVSAIGVSQEADDITIGGQLYDRWYAALGVAAPQGNHPIWERQTSNSRSGADTWRCAECHGWDYKGSEGAYRAGSHYTGFPNVMKLARAMSVEEIVGHLKGSKDPSHDFSAYIDDENMKRLALFLKEGVMDDALYVDATTFKVINASLVNGQKRYEETCATCHGADGKTIIFRTEGVNEYLGTVANRDPYRFLHRTRFGVAGTEMPVGRMLGWTPAEGRDILAYVQTLPTGVENEVSGNAGENSQTTPQAGGPAQGLGGGILTGLAAFFGVFGMSIFFLGGIVLIAVIAVYVLRQRK